MRKAYFLSVFIWCLLVLAACGKDEELHYYDIRIESEQLAKMEEDQFLMGRQYYQGEPVSLIAESSSAEGAENAIDVYICPVSGDKKLLLSGVSNEYRSRGWYLDEKGHCFILQREGVVRLDADGKLLSYSKTSGTVRDICGLDGGRIVLLTLENAVPRLEELDPDTGDIARIDNVSLGRDKNLYIGASGKKLTLLDEKGFWQVDLKKGTKELTLSFAGTFYTVMRDEESPADIRVDGSGAGILWDSGKVEQLARVDISKERKIITVRSASVNTWLKNQAYLFNQTNETWYAVFEEPGEGIDDIDFRTETNLKLTSGKGADIICSSAVDSDISELIEKGIFADLTPLMEDSGIREEEYFRATFDSWREDEKIYGVVPMVSPYSYALDKEVFNGGEELTIESLVDSLLEFKGNRVFGFSQRWNGVGILEFLLEGTESLWGMVDWENGTCDFGGELFSKMLRVAKRYAYDEKQKYPEIIHFRPCQGLYFFDTADALEAKNQVDMGWFFDDEHYAQSNIQTVDAMGINASSEHVKGAWQLLAFLLGEEVQSTITYASFFPVNRNAFDKLAQKELEEGAVVKKVDENGKTSIIRKGGQGAEELTEDKIEEIRQLLAGSKSLPYRVKPLLAIIEEETAYYFDGVKEIPQVVDAVENRVGLYLMERR